MLDMNRVPLNMKPQDRSILDRDLTGLLKV